MEGQKQKSFISSKLKLTLKNFVIVLIPFSFVFGILSGLLGDRLINHRFQTTSSGGGSELREGGYRLVNPLLDCEIADQVSYTEIRPFKNKLLNLVNKEINSGVISNLSIYYRDLNNGPWIGINEQDDFTPASLLKLPLLMTYYKQAEINPDILKKVLKYKGDTLEQTVQQNILPEEELEKGKSYTVDELINRMIIFSDNHAMSLLYTNVNENAYNQTYTTLGIPIPKKERQDDYMSVQEYASFFRMLFNASYLNPQMSEKALELLTRVAYKKGLSAGIPSSIPIAHKFGERKIENTDKKQLHDCGVIYYPNHPYLLCVMTRGSDFEKLGGLIEDISQSVYQEVNNNFR